MKIKSHYSKEDSYLLARGSKLPLGFRKGGFAPYDLLPGALSYCYYLTMEYFLKEKYSLELDGVDIEVTGEKREESPKLLKWVKLDIVVNQDLSDEEFTKVSECAKMASEKCSVYITISKVADISYSIKKA